MKCHCTGCRGTVWRDDKVQWSPSGSRVTVLWISASLATRINIFKTGRAGFMYSMLAKSRLMVTFSHDAPSVLSWEPHCVTCSTELRLAYLSTTVFQVRRAELVPKDLGSLYASSNCAGLSCQSSGRILQTLSFWRDHPENEPRVRLGEMFLSQSTF